MSKSTIIVTGAAGNLGTAVVERLLQDHEHLSLTVGPNADRDRIPPGNWSAETVDLMNEQAAAAYVERTGEQFDRIDAAVLLVGGYAPGGLAETDGAAIQKMYRLNFETAYFMVRPLLARFKAQGGGRFVFIGSRPPLGSSERREKPGRLHPFQGDGFPLGGIDQCGRQRRQYRSQRNRAEYPRYPTQPRSDACCRL